MYNYLCKIKKAISNTLVKSNFECRQRKKKKEAVEAARNRVLEEGRLR